MTHRSPKPHLDSDDLLRLCARSLVFDALQRSVEERWPLKRLRRELRARRLFLREQSTAKVSVADWNALVGAVLDATAPSLVFVAISRARRDGQKLRQLVRELSAIRRSTMSAVQLPTKVIAVRFAAAVHAATGTPLALLSDPRQLPLFAEEIVYGAVPTAPSAGFVL